MTAASVTLREWEREESGVGLGDGGGVSKDQNEIEGERENCNMMGEEQRDEEMAGWRETRN